MICLPVLNSNRGECGMRHCRRFRVKWDGSDLGIVSENPSKTIVSISQIRFQKEGSMITPLLHSAERRDFSQICAYGHVHQIVSVLVV